MKTETDYYEKLQDKYADILDLYWGFEVGDGWHKLIEELLEGISKLEKLDKNFKIVQVKEKFGTLRIYTRHARKEVLDLIREAEVKSEVTCEACGDKGNLNNDGWMMVRCDPCNEARKKKP